MWNFKEHILINLVEKAEDLKMDLTERSKRTVLSCVVTFAVVCLKCVHGELVLSDFSIQVWCVLCERKSGTTDLLVVYNVKSVPPFMFLILVALCVFKEPYILIYKASSKNTDSFILETHCIFKTKVFLKPWEALPIFYPRTKAWVLPSVTWSQWHMYIITIWHL